MLRDMFRFESNFSDEIIPRVAPLKHSYNLSKGSFLK